MIITDIKQGRENKLHVYIDGEYTFTVTDEICYRYDLKKGCEISVEELDELNEKYIFSKAKNKALSLLSSRDHSEYELRQKLRRQFAEDAVDYALGELERMFLIDDERFASAYAAELQRNRKFSHRRIEQELYAKGISREVAARALEELPEDAQSQIYEIIDRKYKNSIADEKGVRRAVAALARLGYSYGDIYSVIKEYSEEFDYED